MTSRKIVVGLMALTVCVAAIAVATGQLAPAASGMEGAKYKGASACKMCHDKEHEGAGYNPWAAWQEMKHAKAMESLTAEQIASGKDAQGRACVSCHTTGYGKESGFVSVDDTPKLAGVGCEACHGPGSLHIMTMAMAEEGEEIADKKIGKSAECITCHNPHISYKKLYGKK